MALRFGLSRAGTLLLVLGSHLGAVSGCSVDAQPPNSGATGGAPDSGSTGGQPSCPNASLGEPLDYDCDPLRSQDLYVKKACGGTAIARFQTDAYTNRVLDDASGQIVFVEHGGVTTTPCTSGAQICDELDFVIPPGRGFVPLAESVLCLGQGGMGGSR